MSRYSHQSLNRIKGCCDGVSYNPFYTKRVTLPNQVQLSWIEDALKEFEELGVDVSWMQPIKSDAYKKTYADAGLAIRSLNALQVKLGIRPKVRWVYTNLCKDKETGKRIKYRTRKRYAAPVGYEYIGELGWDLVYDDPDIKQTTTA